VLRFATQLPIIVLERRSGVGARLPAENNRSPV
jgi:hypothetical protein